MASGPLAGIRVLDLTQVIAGPLGCMLLSDLGAEVIKVEPPEGEPWRLTGQFFPDESKAYQSLNRGKQSVVLNLARPEGQEAVHRLARTCDVVVINSRPDVAKRLGVDYETLKAQRDDIIYLDSTAFGRKGPWAHRPGYDIVAQAASGLLMHRLWLDDRGFPALSGPAAPADFTTGYAIALGVCAALHHRSTTGRGQLVETSLLTNALSDPGIGLHGRPRGRCRTSLIIPVGPGTGPRQGRTVRQLRPPAPEYVGSRHRLRNLLPRVQDEGRRAHGRLPVACHPGENASSAGNR
ncbi:MAG: CoA transferase [Dehalococcoidia bacterium]|nr:CoA transferase [Dehalococcoidia bacterium]